MKIILYGSYGDEIRKKISKKYIVAWIPERKSIIEEPDKSKLPIIELKEINYFEYDFILIAGEKLESKFLYLLNQGVKAHRIRTVQDLTWERHEQITKHFYFNELCLDNIKNNDDQQRILMVAQDLSVSGAPIVFYNMACSLQRLGYRIIVYCQCNGPMREKFLSNGIPVCIEDLIKRENLANWIYCENFSLVIVNTLLQYRLVQKLGQIQMDTIWWLHECENYYYSILETEGKMPQIAKEIYPVFVGEKVENDYHIYFEKSLRDTELLYGLEDRIITKKVTDNNRDKVVFAIIGAIQYRKGQDIFIDAVKALTESEREQCIFRIIGESSFKDNGIMQYIQDAEAAIDEIKYMGGVAYDDMQDMYGEIDVIVCPSRIDPMPVVVTEGLMNRKICVVSNKVGNAKYILDGENGFVFEANNADKLAQKFRYIIEHWGKLEEIGNNGRKIYEKYFTLGKFDINIANLLKKIRKGKEKMIIFTSICSNYTHKARLLAESVKKNIPGAKFIVCLTEREIPDAINFEFFDEIILAKDIWEGNFDHFIFKHNIVEASTAVKGRCLQYLLETCEAEKFIYLDPDCYIYSDFEELRELLDKKPIVVCPHLLQPGNIDMELSATAHGIYNLGFLAVKRCEESLKFVNWWTERLELFCYDDIGRGIFTDQKWVDLAPCFFDVEIFKHRGYDFSIWSLLDCGLEERDGEYFVKGDPLRFIHFSGQGAMAEKCMKDWLPNKEHPFRDLYQEYCEKHEKSDEDGVSQISWSYGFYNDGSAISDKVRIAYRENISWLPVANPFELNDEILAGKMGISMNNQDVPLNQDVMLESMKIISRFYDVWSRGKKIIFYGAGIYGKEFYEFCNRRKLPVTAFMVSTQLEQKEFCGIPVVPVENNNFDKEEVIIIPTLRVALHKEVFNILSENGYKNIFTIENNEYYHILRQFIKTN